MSDLLEISADDARLAVLHAQGLFAGALPLRPSQARTASLRRRTEAVESTLRHLGAVQLDTVSVLARSHEVVQYSRLGAIGREAVETAYWGGGKGLDHPGPVTTFEYWSHAASVLPVEEWPWFAFRRRFYTRRGVRWHDVPTHALDALLARMRAEGPLTTTDLGGAKRSGEWWDWSEAKIGIEWLLDVGQVVCVRRVGWRRVYDLAERAVPVEHRTPDASWVDVDGVHGPDDDTCLRELLLRSVRVCGVGTAADVADVHRLGSKTEPRSRLERALADLVAAGDVVRVRVQGWARPAYADPAALAAVAAGVGRSRTTLLSPFDSLVWHRERTARLFGMDYVMELYVPQDQRQYGYFTMPVLHGGRLVARVDPKREGRTLTARKVTFETGRRGTVPASAVAGTAAALREAASWVGCDEVRVAAVVPAVAGAPLAAALAARA
jgi:uncharacterized protein YcaQ